jgi:hypothetical protein
MKKAASEGSRRSGELTASIALRMTGRRSSVVTDKAPVAEGIEWRLKRSKSQLPVDVSYESRFWCTSPVLPGRSRWRSLSACSLLNLEIYWIEHERRQIFRARMTRTSSNDKRKSTSDCGPSSEHAQLRRHHYKHDSKVTKHIPKLSLIQQWRYRKMLSGNG